MELLMPIACPNCGLIDEPRFYLNNQHLTRRCISCDKYLGHFTKSLMFDVKIIKEKIWSISDNLNLINKIKNQIGFKEGLNGLDQKLMYWNLYINIKETVI